MALYSTASAAYGSFKSLQECIDAIPMKFRRQLRPKFFQLADTYEKYCEANKTLQSLRKHEHAGAFPREIQMLTEPRFQFSEQFLKSEKEKPESYFNKIRQLFKEVKANALSAVIKAKDEEVIFLERLLHPEEYSPFLLLEIERIHEQELQLYREWEEPCNNESGTSVWSPKKPLRADDDYERARKDVPILAARVIEILQFRDVANLQEALAKIDIRSQDKTSASEAGRSLRGLDESIDRRVMEMVKAALAKGKAENEISRGSADRKLRSSQTIAQK